jgi:hypothetical protein
VKTATPLTIGIRAWQRPLTNHDQGKRGHRKPIRPSQWTFIFDTETTTDPSQRLRVGCFRILKGNQLVQEGLFYDCVTEDELDLLQEIERDMPGMIVLNIGAFRRFFFHYVYRLRATVVGHNLPFDLSRLAVDWAPARGRFKGGFSFTIWPRTDGGGENRFRPRLRIKTLNNRAALIEFAGTARDERGGGFWPGRFIDTHTLAAALTDQSLSLDGVAEIFDTEHRKLGDIKHGQPLTRRYIDYLRRDALVTEELFRKLLEEFERHPIDLDPSRAYSSASIGKAYLEAFGITPPAERSTVPDEVLGYAMSAFYGGRVECRIRKELVPVTYLDVRSMYPTVFTLLGLQRFLIAGEIGYEEATEETRGLVKRITPEELFEQPTWPKLCAIVQVEPDGEDILPVRAKYGDSAARSIGLNYLESPEPLWYSLPDVIASKLLTGKAPRIRRAIRFAARGKLPSLRPLRLRGQVPINPRSEEIFKRVIEERRRVEQDPALEQAEREARGRFLKTFANATSYGIFVELNRQEPTRKHHKLRIFADRSYTTSVSAVEVPGRYCFPPLAVLITGAARLILGMLEREALDRRGSYAFCDTDSMTIATDYSAWEHEGNGAGLSDRDDVLPLEAVDKIVARFESLSPYDFPGSILKVEGENFVNGVRTPVYAWAVSAKRYALMNFKPPEGAYIRRKSDHGLGAYMAPRGEGDGEWLDR